jgi:hypothetical protein
MQQNKFTIRFKRGEYFPQELGEISFSDIKGDWNLRVYYDYKNFDGSIDLMPLIIEECVQDESR